MMRCKSMHGWRILHERKIKIMKDQDKKRRSRVAIGAIAAGSAMLGLVATVTAGAQQPAGDNNDKSAALYMRLCSTCHDSARVLASRRTRTQWEEVIQKMIERGAQGTEDEFAAVQEYLLRVSGKVNVNRALANDIALATGIPAKDADALVAYRKANGDFADFDALCKVPGIDIEKLKQAREAVSF
jgi:competence protein ComEA